MHDDDNLLFDLPVSDRHPRSREDVGLDIVVQWFLEQKNMQTRFGSALRQSIDEVLDGQRTGRYDINHLEKTEKTYLGTKVEIVIRSEFGLERGKHKEMDYKVQGHPVDSKFSLSGNWTIPREAKGHLCLLSSADDHQGTFDVGLVRITEDILNAGQNQDGKKTISAAGKKQIKWLCRSNRMPQNLLLQLDSSTIEAIMSKPSGQQRIDELIRRVQGRVIDRNTAITVARQMDGMKRCRDARHRVRGNGIVLLGHQNDGPVVAGQLGLPQIEKGTFIAVRLIEVSETTADRPAALIDGHYYAIALKDDPEQLAPSIRL